MSFDMTGGRNGCDRTGWKKRQIWSLQKQNFICFSQIIQLYLPQLFEVVNTNASSGKQNRCLFVTSSYHKKCNSLISQTVAIL